MAAKILIAGGSGFVGQALTAALLAQGHQVSWISRSANKVAVPVVTWSQIEKDGLPKCDAVCNVAGQNILDFGKRWTPAFQDAVRSSRINTTQTLTQAIVAQPPQQRPRSYIGISGVGHYENDAHVDEYSQGANNFLAHLTRDLEAASVPLQDNNVRRVIVRSGVVLGRNGGAFAAMYWPFFFGVGGPYGSGKQPFPWIHIDDMARLFVYAIEHEHVTGVLNGVAPEQVTNAEFSQQLAKHMSRPALLPFPAFVLNALLGQERADVLLKGAMVKPVRTLESGFQYRFPTVDSAISDLLRNK